MGVAHQLAVGREDEDVGPVGFHETTHRGNGLGGFGVKALRRGDEKVESQLNDEARLRLAALGRGGCVAGL